MSKKGIIAGCLLAVLTATPALAHEHAADGDAKAAQADGSAVPIGAEEGQEYVTCPSCGKQVVVGRHGQAGKAMVCPYCGKEICPAEEEKALCFGADAGFFSKYVSRGVTLSDDPVFQPNVWLTYNGLNIGVWGNMDLTGYNGNEGEFNELDFTAGYSWDWDKLSLSAGGIYYVFTNTGADDTAELYTALGYDILLQPSLTVFYDFLEADGFYCVLGIGHGFEIPMPLDSLSASLELSAQAGWGSKGFNEFNAGVYKNAFTDYVLTASLPVTIGEYLTVSPMVSYSSAIDKDIRAANEHNDNVVWGATVSVSF